MQNDNVTLVFTREDISLLGEALGELPFKSVSPLISRLNEQLVEQQKRESEVVSGSPDDQAT